MLGSGSPPKLVSTSFKPSFRYDYLSLGLDLVASKMHVLKWSQNWKTTSVVKSLLSAESAFWTRAAKGCFPHCAVGKPRWLRLQHVRPAGEPAGKEEPGRLWLPSPTFQRSRPEPELPGRVQPLHRQQLWPAWRFKRWLLRRLLKHLWRAAPFLWARDGSIKERIDRAGAVDLHWHPCKSWCLAHTPCQ